MTVALLTNIISPHQLPLARELAKLVGAENYRYIYTEDFHADRAKMGWNDQIGDLKVEKLNSANRRWLEAADLVYIEERDVELIETRLRANRLTFYVSERWFKPIRIIRLFGLFDCLIPGMVRIFDPRYRRMCARFMKFFESPCFRYLPQGVWAKKDMMSLCNWLTGRTHEEKMTLWGYFVAPSVQQSNNRTIEQSNILKVLWVGRMLHWKRVDTIIRAVREVEKRSRGGQRPIRLTLVGDGPEKSRLQALVNRTIEQSNNQTITFLPSQPIDKIREIMQSNDVYVLSSNGEEGWGAALSEALEEGLRALGTYEAGSSSTILPESNLFHVGDFKTLARKLVEGVKYIPIGDWSAKRAAERMLALCEA